MDHPRLLQDFLEGRREVFRFICALTRDLEASEDVFQELSLAVMDEAAKGGTPSNFMAWIREVARHRVADYYRRSQREAPLSESMERLVDLAFSENETPPEVDRVRQKHLVDCLRSLSRRARELIERRYHDRMSLDDVATAIGWTSGAVKSGLSKARKALQECVHSKLRTETTV